MAKQIRHFLRGFGSVLDIFPVTRFDEFVPKGDAASRMRGHWERTGQHIERAMNRFADGQEKQA